MASKFVLISGYLVILSTINHKAIHHIWSLLFLQAFKVGDFGNVRLSDANESHSFICQEYQMKNFTGVLITFQYFNCTLMRAFCTYEVIESYGTGTY